MAAFTAAHALVGCCRDLVVAQVIILGLCIVCAYLIKEYRFYYLPESGAAMLVGLIVGVCTILLFAVLGTMVSTFIIGFLTYYAGKWGWIQIDSSSPLEALLFGALISAVDPVATLSILGNPELNLDPLLYSIVFGESVLNDAVAIVLFNTFLKFEESGSEFTYGAVASLMVEFVFISLGSVACGLVTGLACSFMCKNTNIKGYPAYEITLLFLYAYGSYALAEVMKLSGIMSLFFCGITMAHYNSYNLSKPSQVTAEHIFKSFALVAEFFVFLYMGMGVCAGQFGRWDLKFIILAILFCLVARLFNTFPFSWLANLGRTTKIPMKMQIVLWFAGLRGAIAFALSQCVARIGVRDAHNVASSLTLCIFDSIAGTCLDQTKISTSRQRYQVRAMLTVLILVALHANMICVSSEPVVIFTTIICGGLTEPLLKYTKLKRDREPDSNDIPDDEEEHGLLGESVNIALQISDHHGAHRGDPDGGSDDDASPRLFHRNVQANDLHSFWGNVRTHSKESDSRHDDG
ncbi:Sodium/hydrogen exchanger 3, partial [Globisporangium splendens]